MNRNTYQKMADLYGNWFFGMCSREDFVAEAKASGKSLRQFAHDAITTDPNMLPTPDDAYDLDDVLDYVEEACAE